jgi:tRNA (guanine37-N1)-methyltransferase
MNISIISVFKDLYGPFLQTSLLKRAQENNIVSIETVSFFQFVDSKERIDAPTFGPGAGMLIKPVVVEKAITSLQERKGNAFKIFFSPQGKKLDQSLLKTIAQKAHKAGHLMLIPARYEGMDARVEAEYADMTVSVGDFVLMGGDIPAMMLLEGMLRLIPGVVGKQESVEQESFSGPFLDYPEYTEPVEWHGITVSEIVRSGNHAAIETWRTQQAAQKTVLNNFAWLRTYPLTDAQKKLAASYIPSHYVALMHDEVLANPENRVGTTSVMSIDIHDIARASSTYGLKQFFIVTPLIDQQKIIKKFFSFWRSDTGVAYNANRNEALNLVSVVDRLDQAMNEIEAKEGKEPLLIGTSARKMAGKMISFYDQEMIFEQGCPVLMLLGTGQGLADQLLGRCDYILNPIHGFSDFNHLSVRSAAAIIMDRWLGLNERIEKKLPE